MLDIKFIRDNEEFAKKMLFGRGVDADVLDDVLKFDHIRREKLTEIEAMKREMNEASDAMAELRREGKMDEFKQKTTELKTKSAAIKEKDAELKEIENKLKDMLSKIPNVPHEHAPIGKTEDDNVLIKEVGVKKEFDFKPLEHTEIGENLDIIDFKRASKIAGARFPMLKGMGAILERALINFMLDVHKEQGFTEIVPPLLVNKDSLFGTGQLPKFEEDLFACRDDAYYLVPTAEVPLINIHRDEILNVDELPIKYMAYTPCFRREAGSYGKDTKGLIRNHQFNKVELVKFTEPVYSCEELESLTQEAAKILDLLEIPYRIVELCTGDLGFASAKTYDIELWMPGENRYREVSSCSNCMDFQARRLNLRYKDQDKKTEPIHTLNASGLAVGRTFAAILENYQTKDGSIKIPKELVKYMNGVEIITNY